MVVPAAVALFFWRIRGASPSAAWPSSTRPSAWSGNPGQDPTRQAGHPDGTKARVMRDGRQSRFPPATSSRATSWCDGRRGRGRRPVLESQFLEIDEALLTGESDPVRRQTGDRLLSGSSGGRRGRLSRGQGGPAAFAQSTSVEARRYNFSSSPMTRIIDRISAILSSSQAVSVAPLAGSAS